MKKIFANMKMNLTLDEIKNYINDTSSFKKDFVVIPTSIYIPYFIDNNYIVGIQDISKFDNGAYTSNVSAKQVKSMGIDYTLIGHSERRNVFNETLEDVNLKVKKGLENNLKIVLCIGEKLEQKDNYKEILEEQILTVFEGVDKIDDIIIAYEPVWSIGTGLTPTNEEIETITDYIKSVVNKKYNKDIDVLYGGSVNEKNIESLNTINNVSGFLVGGASLNKDKIYKIIESTK